MVVVFRHVGTMAWESEVLKMSVSTSESWSAENPVWDIVRSCSLTGVDSLPHVCCGHTLGQLMCWCGEPDAWRGVGSPRSEHRR